MINLAYDDRGSGEPVVFIAGHGGAGRTWHPYQVPAFLAAGYRVITFDNRGIGATENADGFSTQTMVADTVALIEGLNAAPPASSECRWAPSSPRNSCSPGPIWSARRS
ncbi:alpha/beta hydrolase family protein [Mycobacterium intracellulare]|nr:alpha/beta hydrolase family protein [Mycobacterium intracellulare]